MVSQYRAEVECPVCEVSTLEISYSEDLDDIDGECFCRDSPLVDQGRYTEKVWEGVRDYEAIAGKVRLEEPTVAGRKEGG